MKQGLTAEGTQQTPFPSLGVDCTGHREANASNGQQRDPLVSRFILSPHIPPWSLLGPISPGMNFPLQLGKAGPAEGERKDLVWQESRHLKTSAWHGCAQNPRAFLFRFSCETNVLFVFC